MAAVVAQLSLIQMDQDEARMQVASFDIHPDYNPTTRVNDIALIRVINRFYNFILIKG